MRQLIVGAAAILLLVLVSIVVIVLAPGGAWFPRSGARPEPDAAPALSADPPASRVEAIRSDLARPEAPPPPLVQGPPPPRPAEGSWEAVPPVARPSDLGPVGGAIGRALNELQPRLSACFDEATQSGSAPHAATAVRDAATLEDHGTTVLMLQVETVRGAARIVDAPVATYGGASDAVVSCAQRVLRGHLVPAPQAQPGSRHRLLFSLLQ